MAGVTVTFGANIQALVDGVEGAKETIKGFMAAFAVDKIANFTEEYAKLGDQIETGAKQFGTSAAQYQELGYVAKMAGGDNQGLVTSLGRLQLELQQAQNPTSRQAQALNALGLSAKALIGLPLPEQLAKVADAFTRYADGPNKAAIAQALFRNASGEMIAALDEGSAGMKRLYDQAIATGAIMSGQTVKGLADVDRATIGLKASLSTLGGEVVALGGKELVDLANQFADTAGDATKLIETGNIGSYALRELRGVAEDLIAQLGRLAAALTGIAAPFKAYATGGVLGLAKELYKGDWIAQFKADMATADAIAETTHKKLETDLAAMQGKAKAQYDDLIKHLNAPAAGDKPQAPAMATNAGAETAAAAAKYAGEIRLADQAYSQKVQLLNEEVKAHQISYDQENAALVAALNDRATKEMAAIDAELALYAKGTAGYAKALAEQSELAQKYWADLEKLQAQKLQQDTKDWENALKPIEGAWNSQLRSMLTGTETFAQAMKKIFADIAMQGIEKLESIGVEKLAGGLASAFGGGPSSLLGQGGQAAAQTANTTALGTLTTAIIANTGALTGSAAAGAPLNLLSGAGSAAAGGGGIFSTLLTPLKGLFGMLGLPFFDVGTDQILRGGLGVLHPGETIVPAQGSGPFTGAGLGGGSTTHNWNISAIDGPSLQRFLGAGGARQIANAVAGVQKITPSMAW